MQFNTIHDKYICYFICETETHKNDLNIILGEEEHAFTAGIVVSYLTVWVNNKENSKNCKSMSGYIPQGPKINSKKMCAHFRTIIRVKK